MSEQDNSTRLARLEASLEFIKDMLKDMQNDIKGMPSQEDYNHLRNRINLLEKNQMSLAMKVSGAAALISMIVPYIFKMMMGN